MAASTNFPLTNQELFDLSKGELLLFPASREDYWDLLEAAEYRTMAENQFAQPG